MPEACSTLDLQSRKTYSLILRALQAAKQAAVAEAMGVSESTVSRLKAEELARFCALLTACGLKVVPGDAECYSPEYLRALRTLAREALGEGDGAAEPVTFDVGEELPV